MTKLAALVALALALVAPATAQADTAPQYNFGLVPVGTVASTSLGITAPSTRTIARLRWQFNGANYDSDFMGVFSIDPASTCQVGQTYGTELTNQSCSLVIDAESPVAKNPSGDEVDVVFTDGSSESYLLSANFAVPQTVTAFALVKSEGGVMYEPLNYTLNPSTCPRIEARSSGFQDGVAYLEDTGASFGSDALIGDMVVGGIVFAVPGPDANYTVGDEFCIPMLGPLPTVDINGVSIMEGTTVLANTALQTNVVRKSVTLKMRDTGTHSLHNTVRVYNAAGKVVASGKHLGLGIKLVASLVKGHTYRAVFRASGYARTNTVTRTVTVQ
jgi:hypothetical protein